MSEKSYTVIHRFSSGQWTYRPGDKLTEADLQLRGMEDSDFARHLRRGEIAESTSAEAKRSRTSDAPKTPAILSAPPPAPTILPVPPETKI